MEQHETHVQERHVCCLYTRIISFSMLFPRGKIRTKKYEMHIGETVKLDEVTH